jgi:hypothetical protein
MFAYSVDDYEAFEATAVHVNGKVLSVKRESHATGRRGGRVTIERPLVQFTVPGTQHEITAMAKVMSRREFAAGTELPLEFNPRSPEESLRVEAGLPLPDVAFGAVGLTLLVFGAAERWRWHKAQKRWTASTATPPAGPPLAPVKETEA